MSQKFGSFQGTGNTKYLNYNGSVTSGDIWFDHSNAAIKIYNGTSWDEVGSGSGGGGITYSVHTSNVTATANQGIIADTSGGSFTVTLPASPTTGDKVFIADGADFSTNNLTVARNGSTIEGASEDFVMDIGGPNVGFIYDGTTWQVYPQSGLMGLRGIDDNATSTAITIDADGDVGIGTTSPFAKSHIVDTGWSSGAPYGTVQLIEGNNVNENNDVNENNNAIESNNANIANSIEFLVNNNISNIFNNINLESEHYNDDISDNDDDVDNDDDSDDELPF